MKPILSVEEWIKENGYDKVLVFTPDNLAAVLNKYHSQFNQSKEDWCTEDKHVPGCRCDYVPNVPAKDSASVAQNNSIEQQQKDSSQ